MSCTTRTTTTCEAFALCRATPVDASKTQASYSFFSRGPAVTTAASTLDTAPLQMQEHQTGALMRTLVIGLTAFLTVVDLFATQAILPTLTRAYGVTPA